MTGKGPILVPLDFSPESKKILEFAEREAERAASKLLLLHVAWFRDPLRQRPPLLLTDPLEDCARAITRIPSTEIDVLMTEGEPIRGILNTARIHDCPMIIMGRGGTPERPGHVASSVQQKFLGKVYLISRFDVEAPAA
jgi:nucleotide-binding universal stress UspA family protein